MEITVHFYSYFKDLTGCARATESLARDATVGDLLTKVCVRFPKLAAMPNSILAAVGVDYQPRDHPLRDGDEVSLFPPVQGG